MEHAKSNATGTVMWNDFEDMSKEDIDEAVFFHQNFGYLFSNVVIKSEATEEDFNEAIEIEVEYFKKVLKTAGASEEKIEEYISEYRKLFTDYEEYI